MSQQKYLLPKIPLLIQRYGLGVLSVAIALGLALFFYRHNIQEVEFPVFLIAIAVTAWYAGTGPSVLALILASLAFNYYFTEPYGSFYITAADVPYYAVFILFAVIITWFSAVRRRVERELVQSRDKLQEEVAARTQQASLLDLANDPIFVRDMNGLITYWNRGAQQLYGWTPEQAVGKSTNELLRTVFPKAFAEIQSELLRTGRWEGELEKTKADGTRVLVSSRWSLYRDERQNPVAILESENDITERKRREDEIRDLNRELAKYSSTQRAYLDELFDQTPEGLALIDGQDRVLRINQEFTRMFGYASEDAVGRLINDLVAPDELRAEADDFTRRCITRKESVTAETIRQRKDGTRIPVSLLTFPISVPDGQIAEYAIYRDLTRYRAVEGELMKNRA
jgi:PAS domain S-box-containing protein